VGSCTIRAVHLALWTLTPSTILIDGLVLAAAVAATKAGSSESPPAHVGMWTLTLSSILIDGLAPAAAVAAATKAGSSESPPDCWMTEVIQTNSATAHVLIVPVAMPPKACLGLHPNAKTCLLIQTSLIRTCHHLIQSRCHRAIAAAARTPDLPAAVADVPVPAAVASVAYALAAQLMQGVGLDVAKPDRPCSRRRSSCLA
jgi:hypothetical protein